MKVKDLLKYLHYCEQIRIYEPKDDEVLYRGDVMSVPFYLINTKIIKPKDNEDYSIGIEDDFIAIYVDGNS